MQKYLNEEFFYIIDRYANNESFSKTKKIFHHGISRYDHLYRVSYYSYVVTKFLHLNYKEATVGALLHDFFLNSNEWTKKEQLKSYFVHPKIALKNACTEFNLTDMEKNIIVSHMFPVNIVVPRYLESWIVSIIDKICSTAEFSIKFKKELSYSYKLFLLFLINKIK